MRCFRSGLSGVAAAGVLVGLLVALPIDAQPPGFGGRGGGGPGGGALPSARDSAPVDLIGTWVSLVTEDWIERMSPDSPRSGTPGGFGGIGGGPGGGFGGGPGGGPGGPGGGPGAERSNDPCAAYGAGGIMRVPGRVRISWQDDQTMRLEFDAGSQRRVVYFSADAAPSANGNGLQGVSIGTWQGAGGGGGRGRGRGGGPNAGFGAPTDGRAGAARTSWASLKIETTNLSAGYLLSSKGWYRDGATLTELIRPHSDFGNEYFTVTAIVSENGATTNLTSSTFMKESDDSKFSPSACEITP